MNAMSDERLAFRAVFISDAHLGTRGARAEALAQFLRSVSTQHLFLVGDMIDGWRLRRSWYWDAAHDEVLRLILKHARSGASVTYVPGNHDEMLRRWLGLEVAGVRLARECEHTTAAGLRLLVMHGDEFDSVVRYAPFLALLGDWAYTQALIANRHFNTVRRRLGYPYWSLSQWLKRQVKGAVKAIDRFEGALAGEARRRGFDGVVCGHIHHAEMREVDGILYLNDGDWVESCTALVEHPDGRLELVDWSLRQGGPAAIAGTASAVDGRAEGDSGEGWLRAAADGAPGAGVAGLAELAGAGLARGEGAAAAGAAPGAGGGG